jgi:hypothetical protein
VPALAKQASTRPSAASVAAKAASTAASSPTSQSAACTRTPVAASSRRRLRVLLRIGAPDRDIRAGLGQRLRHAEADAGIAAGHQRDLAGQVEGPVGHQ